MKDFVHPHTLQSEGVADLRSEESRCLAHDAKDFVDHKVHVVLLSDFKHVRRARAAMLAYARVGHDGRAQTSR
eukprot:3926779-Pyramimonas_sp.AAC.1